MSACNTNSPASVKERVRKGPREPAFDPTLGRAVKPRKKGSPPHRLVAIGDSLTHGMQSGAVFNTDLSYPAIVAYELGWLDRFRYPRYGGPGGLPLNIELLLRNLEAEFGSDVSMWELPLALFRARSFLDRVEDYWERGPGLVVPRLSAYVHDLAVYGWDLRDALSRTAAGCERAIEAPDDNLIDQEVKNGRERAALRVYPGWSHAQRQMTLFQAAAALGEDHDDSTECGIETLVVFLGANNALRSVTDLRVCWSGDHFRDLERKVDYTVWTPEHFDAEFADVVAAVKAVKARHVIWCTIPHVTIAPIARGIGEKIEPGSSYFRYYVRPWVREAEFSPKEDPHITGTQACEVDAAIDLYNETIERAVQRARAGTDGRKRDWFLLDTAGLLDRLATRRYIADRHMRLDPTLRPTWWSEYTLPAPLLALDPVPNSRFLTGDGKGGRATGGLFSLDGVHPTTVGYGVIAQEIINIMRLAGVEFRHVTGAVRSDPVTVDFARLILRDSLIRNPPQNITSTLEILGWADQTLDWIKRTLSVTA